MKKSGLFFAILLVLSLDLNAFGHYDNSVSSPHDKLKNFESLSIHIPARTELIRGSTCSVDIQMSEKTARNIEVYTDRGTLIIKSKSGSWIRRSDEIIIKITMPYWESLSLSASGHLYSEDKWNLDHVLIRNSGSCDINLNRLDADKMEYRGSSSGDISIAELFTSFEAEFVTTGSGHTGVGLVKSESLSVELTGSGDFRGGVKTETFLAKTTGSGEIAISGSCERADLQSTGSGGIMAEDLSAGEVYVRTTGSGDIILKDGAQLKEIRMTGSGTFRSI